MKKVTVDMRESVASEVRGCAKTRKLLRIRRVSEETWRDDTGLKEGTIACGNCVAAAVAAAVGIVVVEQEHQH